MTGAADANRTVYRWIEEQRQGAEWIVRGYATEKPAWMGLGWRQLNWGIAHQRPDGANPEKNGIDANYQMVGVLMALRYWPVCCDAALRLRLANAIRRAITWELERQQKDGSIDSNGSTRVGTERARSGKIKEVNYAEIVHALVFGSQALGEPSWLNAAHVDMVHQYKNNWQTPKDIGAIKSRPTSRSASGLCFGDVY